MSEQTMPAAEAEGVVLDERNSYELAFHVLPTVAEGEVADVVASMKDAATTAGATVTSDEAPQRIELAYEIVKSIEGKHRKFSSAYFGWIRFQAPADAIASLNEALEENTSLLRHLLIKLTKVEEAHPVYYHELMAKEDRMVDTVDVEQKAPAPAVETTDAPAEDTTEEADAAPEAETAEATEEAPAEDDTKSAA